MARRKYPKDTDGDTGFTSKIRSSDGKLLGEVDREDEEDYGCDLEGCGGHAIYVEWPDGDETVICSAGLTMGKDGWWRISS
jgi:hypothetical protein